MMHTYNLWILLGIVFGSSVVLSSGTEVGNQISCSSSPTSSSCPSYYSNRTCNQTTDHHSKYWQCCWCCIWSGSLMRWRFAFNRAGRDRSFMRSMLVYHSGLSQSVPTRALARDDFPTPVFPVNNILKDLLSSIHFWTLCLRSSVSSTCFSAIAFLLLPVLI